MLLRAKEGVAPAEPGGGGEAEAFQRPARAPDDSERHPASVPKRTDGASGASSRVRDYATPALLLLFFLVLWQAAVAVFALPHYILPSPILVFQTLGQSWEILLFHAGRTLVEVLAGFGAALAAGFVLAVGITYSRALRRALYPLVIASQTIPVIAIAPLLVIWFGYDMMPKVVMTALIAFFPVVVNTVDGLEATDPDLLDLMRLLQADWWQIFRKARFPAALPFIFSGLKIAAAISVIGAVIGEWVGADRGLGFLMIRANAQLRTDLIFASIVILSAMGILLFLAVCALERISMPWERGNEG